MITRKFEFDDAPRDIELLIPFLDQCKAACPGFKATVFAIPAEMRRRHWQPFHARREWVHVGVHGFAHDKRECRDPRIYGPKLHMLRTFAKDKAWAKAFKSPWWAYDRPFIEELTKIGYPFGIACLSDDWGYPPVANARAWSWNDALDEQKWRWWSFHPVPRNSHDFKLSKTCVSEKYRTEYLDSLRPDDAFEFVEDIAEPLCVKINLGCGYQVWPGWQCFDRSTNWAPGVRQWAWPQQIPYACCRADIVFMSHLLEYIPDDHYEDLFLDIWRVLRPCGILRISDLDGYEWRPIGCERTRHTGRIESKPTWDRVRKALWNVGFQVFASRPDETLSPHKDVLLGATRARHWRRKNKFYADAVKAQMACEMKRVRHHDPRMARSGKYFHVSMPQIVQLFFKHSKIVGNRREIVEC